MKKIKRLLLLAFLLTVAAFAVLCAKVGYPHHRTWAVFILVLSWIPLGSAWYLNRRHLRVSTKIVRKKTRPWIPYVIVAAVLALFLYVAHTLSPVKGSPLAGMDSGQLRSEMETDFENYLVLCGAIDNLVSRFEQNELLAHDVASLTPGERETIGKLWREGFDLFVECDMLKEKYGGFHQIDYTARPELHANAFFLAYATYIAQYRACSALYEMATGNAFMETLLNESAPGLPEQTFHVMKTLLIHPQVILRAHAGALYYELVKDQISFDEKVVGEFEARRSDFFAKRLFNTKIFIENPVGILEEAAFKAWFPLQKHVALQMSNIRAATRDFLITSQLLASVRGRLEPGDILLQRRNWYMTNLGIPGFWPHAALYIGSFSELEAYFGEELKQLAESCPAAYQKLHEKDDHGFSFAVLEAIKDGVNLHSLEHSAHCDCLAVIRPKLTKSDKLKVVLNAFSHYQKPYDMNFDFATDNELVCSELVYKAYNPVDKDLFTPEIVNGRLLLPPNLMAEQVSQSLQQPEPKFSCVLFLDTVESETRVFESTADEFIKSYQRPKWYVLQ